MVIVGGAASLGMEMAASRLLAPYFGSSLYIWACLIGLILLYLTVGYYVGGRLVDRRPSGRLLYTLTTIAALWMGAIPLVSKPFLLWSQQAFSTYSEGLFIGTLVSVLLLFSVPTILLGCVSPFAIRLQVQQVGKSGRIAGMLYAISTGGSILGTFLPVLVFIPNVGTANTFLILASSLLVASVLGLVVESTIRFPERKLHQHKSLLTILLLIPLLGTTLGLQGPIKPPYTSGGSGELKAEKESAYNYIQVVQVGDETRLILNEGLGVHSIYNPHQELTRGPWDYFAVAPFFNNAPFRQEQVKDVCVIGLGAGTVPHQFNTIYGKDQVQIDGIEIDPEIVNMGRKYFDMNQPNLNVVVEDGRPYLNGTDKKYDVIGIDAYQQPYIPFQLTTTEFMQEVRNHLTSTGVAVLNAGRTGDDYRLVDAMAKTMKTVFPNVYKIDTTSRFTNTLIIATNAETSLDNFATNLQNVNNPLLRQIANNSLSSGNIREETEARAYFTDDQAPIEQLINMIIFGEVQKRQ
jgi:predicted membrane-bound spermidine synthase